MDMQAWYIVETGNDEPSRIDAYEPTKIEMTTAWSLHPREPQAYAAKEEEHVHAKVAHATKPEKNVGAREVDMEKDDDEHGNAHKRTAETRDIGKFYVRNPHGNQSLGFGM